MESSVWFGLELAVKIAGVVLFIVLVIGFAFMMYLSTQRGGASAHTEEAAGGPSPEEVAP